MHLSWLCSRSFGLGTGLFTTILCIKVRKIGFLGKNWFLGKNTWGIFAEGKTPNICITFPVNYRPLRAWIALLASTCQLIPYEGKLLTSGPRWPWIAHLNFLDDHSHFFCFVAFREEFTRISVCLHSASSAVQNLTSCFRGEFWRISLKSTQWKKPPPMVAMLFDGSKFHEQFLKRVTHGTILWNYSKFWPAFSNKKIF